MPYLVVGAGPAGLYTVIKLYDAGLRDLVLCDPRVGIYTRPGHLTKRAYKAGVSALPSATINSSKTYHIKELERILYARVLELGIRVEKKAFLRLYQNENQPGAVLWDEEANSEVYLPTDYVFDCSGTKRAVVKAINQLIPGEPLKLVELTALPIKNNFIAYVTMSKAHFKELSAATLIKYFTDHEEKSDYLEHIIALRNLGWEEYSYPDCYGTDFGKDKVCFYLHAPDNLPEARYTEWVQTVFNCYANDIVFQQVKPSRKYAQKSRFSSFTRDAQIYPTPMSFRFSPNEKVSFPPALS